MIATCHHTVRVTEVDPPLDVCPSCIEEGGWWKHLRQCLICGKTGCCDESPNRHASGHYRSEGHEIIRNAESDGEWTWCYADEVNLRLTEGIWEEVDLFFEAGIWFANQAVEQTGTFDPGPDEVTPEGFPSASSRARTGRSDRGRARRGEDRRPRGDPRLALVGPPTDPGLCGSCRHARRIETTRALGVPAVRAIEVRPGLRSLSAAAEAGLPGLRTAGVGPSAARQSQRLSER